MHSSTLSLTSAQNEGGWPVPRPGRFTPGKDPVPIVHRRPGGAEGRLRMRGGQPHVPAVLPPGKTRYPLYTRGRVEPRVGCVCGVDNPTSRPFYPLERPGTHCIGGRASLRAGLDGCGKSRPVWIRSPDRPTRNESLYRLSYPGPRCVEVYIRQREEQTPQQAPVRRQIW